MITVKAIDVRPGDRIKRHGFSCEVAKVEHEGIYVKFTFTNVPAALALWYRGSYELITVTRDES